MRSPVGERPARRMRQAVYRSPRSVAIVQRDVPALDSGDVLVAVEACGVCGSDVASYMHGHYVQPGQVMGHESVGIVAGVGAAVEHLAPGDRVVVRPLRACGDCWHCRRGDGHLCGATATASIGYGADGAFADQLLVRDEVVSRQLVPILLETPVEDAVWAEPLAVALHALDRGGLSPGARVMVLGAGPIGLAVVAAALAAGAHVEVVEPREQRLAAALALGARPAIDGAPVEIALDASGAPSAIAAAYERLAAPGKVVLVGLGDAPIPTPPHGVELRGAFAFTAADFVRSVRLIETGRVRLGGAVSHRFGLEQIGRAIEAAAGDSAALKVILRPQADLRNEPGADL